MSRLRYWQVKFLQQFVALVFKMMSWVSALAFGRLFFRLEVRGLENLKGHKGPMILTPTHKSYVDHFFIGAVALGRVRAFPMGFAAADWLFDLSNRLTGPLTRFGLCLLAAYPVRRGKGLDVSLAVPEWLLTHGYNFCIYPEGAIKFRPGVHEVKVGAAYLARKTGVPIVPVALRGMEYFMPKTFFTGRRKITVVFGKPFLIAPDTDLKDASELIRSRMSELYEVSRA